MIITKLHEKLNIISEESAFEYLIDNLKSSIKSYDYFVAWNKVLKNVKSIEIPLNILNTLIGKDNAETILRDIISSYPEVVPIIPLLIACRENKLIISELSGDTNYDFTYKPSYENEEINRIILFTKESGLLDNLKKKNIKNLVDYCLGVEVGLDTNARKNRSGTIMENLVEVYIKNLCNKNNYEYIKQATVKKIKERWNIDVPTDKADRHFDFVIKAKETLFVIEVNYYGTGGSKLKSVAGEFRSLSRLFESQNNIAFLWITDGKGWLTAKRPLYETFSETKFVVNLQMIKDGFMEEIINNEIRT